MRLAWVWLCVFLVALACGCKPKLPADLHDAILRDRLTAIAISLSDRGQIDPQDINRTLRTTDQVRRQAKAELDVLMRVNAGRMSSGQIIQLHEAVKALDAMQEEINLVATDKDTRTSFNQYISFMRRAQASVTAAAATF